MYHSLFLSVRCKYYLVYTHKKSCSSFCWSRKSERVNNYFRNLQWSLACQSPTIWASLNWQSLQRKLWNRFCFSTIIFTNRQNPQAWLHVTFTACKWFRERLKKRKLAFFVCASNKITRVYMNIIRTLEKQSIFFYISIKGSQGRNKERIYYWMHERALTLVSYSVQPFL